MIRKMIQSIKRLLRIQDPVNISDEELEEIINSTVKLPEGQSVEDRSQIPANPEDSVQSVVSFLITKSGNIDLNISWDQEDLITAKNLATVLFLINSGNFETNCAELLVQMAQQQPEQMNFVRTIINEWNERKSGETLIKPSEVFQFGTVGTQE